MESELRELLAIIIDGICRKTEQPRIEWSPVNHEFTVQVDGCDQGRMIGRDGIVFWAINTLFYYAGRRVLKHEVAINLLEPAVRNQGGSLPFKPNPDWDRAKLYALLSRILDVCAGDETLEWSVRTEEYDVARVAICLTTDRAQQCQYEEPSLSEAIEIVISAAAKSDGCKATVETTWI